MWIGLLGGLVCLTSGALTGAMLTASPERPVEDQLRGIGHPPSAWAIAGVLLLAVIGASLLVLAAGTWWRRAARRWARSWRGPVGLAVVALMVWGSVVWSTGHDPLWRFQGTPGVEHAVGAEPAAAAPAGAYADPATFETRWTLGSDEHLGALFADEDGLVLTTAARGKDRAGVVALEAGSGEERWHFLAAHPVDSVVADPLDGVVLLTFGQTAVVLDLRTGARRATFALPQVPGAQAVRWTATPTPTTHGMGAPRVTPQRVPALGTAVLTAWAGEGSRPEMLVVVDLRRARVARAVEPAPGCRDSLVTTPDLFRYFLVRSGTGCAAEVWSMFGSDVVGRTTVPRLAGGPCATGCPVIDAVGGNHGLVLAELNDDLEDRRGNLLTSLVGRGSLRLAWQHRLPTRASISPVLRTPWADELIGTGQELRSLAISRSRLPGVTVPQSRPVGPRDPVPGLVKSLTVRRSGAPSEELWFVPVGTTVQVRRVQLVNAMEDKFELERVSFPRVALLETGCSEGILDLDVSLGRVLATCLGTDGPGHVMLAGPDHGA